MGTDKNALAALLVVPVAASLILSSCASQPTAAPTVTATATTAPTTAPTGMATPASAQTATATPIPLPSITLQAGDFYFRVDGKTSFVFSRNVAGYQQTQYDTFLDWTKAGGSKFVRIQLDSLGMG